MLGESHPESGRRFSRQDRKERQVQRQKDLSLPFASFACFARVFLISDEDSRRAAKKRRPRLRAPSPLFLAIVRLFRAADAERLVVQTQGDRLQLGFVFHAPLFFEMLERLGLH